MKYIVTDGEQRYTFSNKDEAMEKYYKLKSEGRSSLMSLSNGRYSLLKHYDGKRRTK